MIRKPGPVGAKGVAPTKGVGTGGSKGAASLPTLMDFVQAGDFTGAVTLLEFRRRTDDTDETTLPWLAYSAFHLGDYRRALEVYDTMLAMPDCPREYNLFRACCLFYLHDYPEAEKAAMAGPAGSLQTRLLFHCFNKLGRDDQVLAQHKKLSDSKADQISLAAMHFLRSHYNEAVDVYKQLLLEGREDVALNLYIALCYYKLDYYDLCADILQVYIQSKPTSTLAINLKACTAFHQSNGRAAEAILRGMADQGLSIEDSDLLRHNMCVFRGGEGALRVLPPLVNSIPEARFNLAVHHLRHGNITEAWDLMHPVDPSLPNEYILKGIVHACLGQRSAQSMSAAHAATGGGVAVAAAGGPNSIPNAEHLRLAQQNFQMVGGSPSECDTIPGRQAMASCLFLSKQFSEVCVYLSSIRVYVGEEDEFLWNYGLALAATGDYVQAEELLLLIQSAAMRAEPSYQSWLARCHCMNGHARQAWDLYLHIDSGPQAMQLLQIIAADSYSTGQFLIAAKAYDVLQRLDSNEPDHWEGLRASAAGVLQLVIAGQEGKDSLREVLVILRSSSNPQAEYISRVLHKWAQMNGGLL